MKKLLTLSVIGTSLILGSNPAKADWDHWAIKASDALSSTGLQFYTVNSATGEATLRTTKCFPQSGINPCKQEIGTNTYVDPETGKFFFENAVGETHSYNLDTDTWTNEGTSWKATYTNSSGSSNYYFIDKNLAYEKKYGHYILKKPFKIIGIGLLFHMLTDFIDCLMIYSKCNDCFFESFF